LDPIHVFGLPQVASYLPNISDPKPLHIYGPPGLGDYLIVSLNILKDKLNRRIVVSEMHNEYKLQDALKQNIKSNLQTQHLGGLLTVQKIFPERSGFWRLVDDSEICVLANKVFDDHSAFGFVVREVNKQGKGALLKVLIVVHYQ
jgi:ribonuclease BN (tRNA processing enzyme)